MAIMRARMSAVSSFGMKVLLPLYVDIAFSLLSTSARLQTGHFPWLFTHGNRQLWWNMCLQGVRSTFWLGTNASKQIVHCFPSSASSAAAAGWEAVVLLRLLLNRPLLLLGYVGLKTCSPSSLLAFSNSSGVKAGSSIGLKLVCNWALSLGRESLTNCWRLGLTAGMNSSCTMRIRTGEWGCEGKLILPLQSSPKLKQHHRSYLSMHVYLAFALYIHKWLPSNKSVGN